MTKEKLSDDARTRVQAMVSTTDGFKLSEFDLIQRGPGDFLGTDQSGYFKFNFLDLLTDYHILIEELQYRFSPMYEYQPST